jgi:hypothetical protein
MARVIRPSPLGFLAPHSGIRPRWAPHHLVGLAGAQSTLGAGRHLQQHHEGIVVPLQHSVRSTYRAPARVRALPPDPPPRVVRALGHALQADERVDDVSSFNERSSTTLSPVVCSCLFR